MKPAPHIAIIGGGQSARWFLFALTEQLARGVQALQGSRLTIIEGQSEVGTGLAWSRRNALEEHLASLPARMSRWSFGERQQVQFHRTLGFLRELGLSVDLRLGQEAMTMEQKGERLEIGLASAPSVSADVVVLATGYGQRAWRNRALPEAMLDGRPGVHISPWPASALQQAVFDGCDSISEARPKHVLILGSYLNGIDAALSLAVKVGRFQPDADGRLHFEAPAGFRITLGSRTGQLPKVWGREPSSPYQPRWFHAERLQQVFESTERGRLLPMDATLELLGDELAEASGRKRALPVAAGGRRNEPMRRRIGAWQRHLARGDKAEMLRRDIAAVMTSGKPFGRYEDTHICAWQNCIDSAIQLWSENSPWFCAEDHLYFDRELRTTFFNTMLPMTLGNALQIEAMMRSGHLNVVALGRGYELQPVTDRVWRTSVSYGTELGRPGLMNVTDVVDATGQYSAIEAHPSPLIQAMLGNGLIQPGLRAFRGEGTGASEVPPGKRRSIIERRGKAYLSTGGIYVNPKTGEVIPRSSHELDYEGPDRTTLYAMGPNVCGQFTDAQSLGQTQRDALRIVADLCRKLSR
ncbi:hypothetical protein ACN469_37390 [Corallococcus terminator]